jgi:adenylate cyclase class 2
MPAETEIKFRVTGRAALARRLRACGFRLVEPRVRECDSLWDTPSGALRRRGHLLRLRRSGRSWLLTFKGKALPGRHKVREELETALADGAAARRILQALGLVESFCYEKFRATWSDGRGLVVVDQTPIGDFAEIEGPPRWIDATARRLGISPREYITRSYASLFLLWKRRTGQRASHMTWKAIREG